MCRHGLKKGPRGQSSQGGDWKENFNCLRATGNSVPSGLSAGTPLHLPCSSPNAPQGFFSAAVGFRARLLRLCGPHVCPRDVVGATCRRRPRHLPPSSGLAELIARVKDRLTRAFVRRCGVHEDEIRRLDQLRTGKGWDFWHFFLVKEGYALLLDQVNLAEDANKQYLELSARTRARMTAPAMVTSPSLTRGPASTSAARATESNSSGARFPDANLSVTCLRARRDCCGEWAGWKSCSTALASTWLSRRDASRPSHHQLPRL